MTTFEQSANFYYGDPMCCDFEKWNDGSVFCYLYEGSETQLQDYQMNDEGMFSCFTFLYGDHEMAVKLQVAASLALALALMWQ